MSLLGTPPHQLAGNLVGAATGDPLAANATALALRVASQVGLSILFASMRDDGVEPTWTLEYADQKLQERTGIAGFGRPEQDSEQESSQITSSGGGISGTKPATIPMAGSPWEKNLTALYLSSGDDDSSLDQIRTTLYRMKAKEPLVGRQPLLRFRYGEIDRLVWLRFVSCSIPFGLHTTGKLRAARVSLDLVEAISRKLGQVPTSPFEKETTWHTLGPGETYELLAWNLLGDPLKGVLIRRINPDVVLAVPDARVRVFDRAHSRMRAPVRPRAVFWSAADAPTYARLTKKMQARLFGAPRAWDALPAAVRTIPDGEPTLRDPGAVSAPVPAYRAPAERDHDRLRAEARGEVA